MRRIGARFPPRRPFGGATAWDAVRHQAHLFRGAAGGTARRVTIERCVAGVQPWEATKRSMNDARVSQPAVGNAL